MATIKHKLQEAAHRVWRAYLKFGPVDDGRPEGDEFEAALLALRREAKDFGRQIREERGALVAIVSAADEFPDPIHFKVKEAINQARRAIDSWECEVEE